MKEKEIVAFAKVNLESIRGPAYRCAAWLADGVYLPCVLIADKSERVRLAIRRFDEKAAVRRCHA